MANVRRCAMFLTTLTLSAALSAQGTSRNQSCVTVVDASSQHPVSGARVSPSGGTAVPAPVLTTDASGRGCLPGRDSIPMQIDAVGYLPIDVALGTRDASRVALQQLPDGMMLPAWGSRQIVAALAQALRRPEIAGDSLTSASLSGVLQRALIAPMQTTVTQDSAGVLVLGYLDLTPDGSRYSELRMRYNLRESIVLGVTTTGCAEACGREHELAMFWAARTGGGWTPNFIARKDTGGAVVRVALDASQSDASPETQPDSTDTTPVRSASTVRGVIRSDKGVALAGIEVYSADGAAATETNARGEYQFIVPMPPGGALLTTRRLGWAPEFHKVSVRNGATAQWNPVLRATTVLATQLVRAAGVPEALRSPRYDGFLTRRARGVGQFFMAEEIWSAVSLGDMLNRARGIRAFFNYGSNLSKIYVPSCPIFASDVGVYVDGVDQTGRLDLGGIQEPSGGFPSAAVNVLTRYVNAAIVGMEIYIGRTQLPPEFADPRYCASIVLWTR